MNAIHQSYLSKFIDSVCYCFEREATPFDRCLLADNIALGIRDGQQVNDLALSKLRTFANMYTEHRSQQGPIEHSCHAVSHGFAATLQTTPFADIFPLALTIGNVWFRGNNIYKVTRQKIDQIIREGFDPDKTLDVHVWLTLSNMTVVDLTLLSTLSALGLSESAPSRNDRVLFWKEATPGDFEFEPLLVDNDFFSKVERGVVTYESV